ncbi:MAG: DUF952 domain-containing protein [Acidimicrobiales bacterium]|nr:DUF952 domain-containing protein [Acidimicrobiales bacterium]
MPPTTIFHIADRTAWADAQEAGTYRWSTRDQTLDEVGFIHCWFEQQVVPTAARHYGDADPAELVVLVIDPSVVAAAGAEVRVEAAPHGEDYPHIYGDLPPAAVVATRALARAVDGTWALLPA